MTAMTSAESILRTGATLTRVDDQGIATARDLTEADPLVILIHGFTAHGEDLRNFGLQLEMWGKSEATLARIRVLVFSYNSYNGIQKAAEVLREWLELHCSGKGLPLRDALKKQVFLVAHSMGGLVARQFTVNLPEVVRGIVLLGTPNDGVPTDRIVDYLISLAERIEDPFPEFRTKSDVSRKQLCRRDAPPGRPFIDELNDHWLRLVDRPPTLSVSGARKMLEISQDRFRNWLINRIIQGLMSGEVNDGLIREKSVDMWGAVFKANTPVSQYSHLNKYAEYRQINHSNLIQNGALMRYVFNWIGTITAETGGG